MEEAVVLTEKKGNVTTVIINRSQVLNALNRDVFFALEKVFAGLESDPEVKAIIITGAGSKAFVGGTDIEMMAGLSPEKNRILSKRINDIFWNIERSNKPVIAAINGFALGGGCELALVCDIRVAASNASFAFPEVSLGILPGSGGTQRLPHLIGKSRAKYMILSSARINADTALDYGLVEKVVPQEELMSTCMKLAEQLAQQPPLSVALAKQAIDIAEETDLKTGIAYETNAFTIAFDSEDKQKLMAAFLEKRNAPKKDKSSQQGDF